MHRSVRPILVPADAGRAAAPSPLDVVMRSLDRGTRKRKPSAFLHEAYHCNLGADEARMAAREACEFGSAPPSARPGAWACRGCGQQDRSKLVLSDDKAAYSCLACGAQDSGVNLQESSYDSNQRTSVHGGEASTSALSAAEFAEADTRAQARKADAAASRNVPSALKRAQGVANAAAARETAALEGLPQRDRRRLDRSLIHVHSIFTSAGFDPDASPICKQILMLCPKLFVRTSTHVNYCKNGNNTCLCAMIKLADVKFIAKACVAHVIAIGEAAAVNGEAFHGFGVLEFRAVRRKLLGELSEFHKNVSSAREAEAAIVKLKTASPDVLCTPCDDNDADDADTLTLAPVVEGSSAAADGSAEAAEAAAEAPGVDEFLQKLALSLVAARQLGWVTDMQLSTLQRHMSSVAAFDFVDEVKTWPPDVVAAMACLKILTAYKKTNTSVKTALKKLSKQHGLTMATVTRTLDAMPTPRV